MLIGYHPLGRLFPSENVRTRIVEHTAQASVSSEGCNVLVIRKSHGILLGDVLDTTLCCKTGPEAVCRILWVHPSKAYLDS